MKYEELRELLSRATLEEQRSSLVELESSVSTVLNELDSETRSESDPELVAQYTLLRSEAVRLMGSLEWRKGSNNKARDLFLEALRLAEDSADPKQIAKTANAVGVVHRSLSLFPAALEFFARALRLYEQHEDQPGIALVLGNIGTVHYSLSDYPQALDFMTRALSIHEEVGDLARAALEIGNIGNVHSSLSNFTRALECYERALDLHEQCGDIGSVARVNGNIGSVHYSLADFTLALNYMNRSLSLHEAVGDKGSVARMIGNIGAVYISRRDYPLALQYLERALLMHEHAGDKAAVARVTSNIGSLYTSLAQYTLALEYITRSLNLRIDLGQKSEVGVSKLALAKLFATPENPDYDIAKATVLLQESVAIGADLGTKNYEAHKALADIYEQRESLAEAIDHLKKYLELKEAVQSDDTKKSSMLMEQRRLIAEREKEIAIAKATADAKHQATEQLLHNVLPPSIAGKMITGSKLIAEKLASVSVLFTDIVGFTKLSQIVAPEQLVEGLDKIFSAFDVLAEKHGLEKIKTIGDAYMVVSGAPEPREDHAEAIAQFALEILESMNDFNSLFAGGSIQLRVGIHSGEVVAGVIGKKKFAYDLWGDAVNTASRMESHGLPNKIHCSEDFVKAVGGLSFHFTERGEMDIKGKGMMRTFFLERA